MVALDWRGMGLEIDDELEVAWQPGSARSESRVWVLFTDDRSLTPFVTSEHWLLRAEPLALALDAGVVWPLIAGDMILSVRKGRR